MIYGWRRDLLTIVLSLFEVPVPRTRSTSPRPAWFSFGVPERAVSAIGHHDFFGCQDHGRIALPIYVFDLHEASHPEGTGWISSHLSTTYATISV